MAGLPENSIDAILTDPPYGWSFMGLDFDKALPDPAVWRECLRVLKPGGSMVAMSGSRLDCLWRVCRDIEGAGFDLGQTAFVHVYRCVSEDTEVLTETGWERYSKSIATKLVLCYNVDAGTFEFHRPRRTFVYDYQYPAIRVHSDKTDQLVTPNHRVLVEREGRMAFEEARTLAPEVEASVPILESLHDLPDHIPCGDTGTSIQKEDLLEAVCRQVHQYQQDWKARAEEGYGGSARHGADHLCCLRGETMEEPSLGEACCEADLFASLQRGSASQGISPAPVTGQVVLDGSKHGELPGEDDRGEQSSLEGWRNLLPQAREVQANQVCAVPAGVPADGPQGWICEGAPPVCCSSTRQVLDPDGNSSPRQPRSDRQQLGKPASLQQQSAAQALRAPWGTSTTLAVAEEVEYHGRMWCIEVPTGAFVARRNGQIFITGNSGFPKGQNLSAAANAKAFRAWLDSVEHGLSAAEVRQVTSAAVNGSYPLHHGGGTAPNPMDRAAGLGDREGMARGNGDAALLSSILARHWHPLPEAEKRAAWEGYGEAHLERPPGVRVRLGPNISGGRARGDEAHGKTIYEIAMYGEWKSAGDGLTTPSTTLARRLQGQYSKGKVKPAWEICIWARKPISEGSELANVVRWGVGEVNCGEAMIPFEDDQKPKGGYGGMRVGMGAVGEHQDYSGHQECNPAGRYPPNLLVQDAALGEEGSRFFDIERWAQEHGFTEDGWAEAAEAGLLQIAKASRGEKNAGCEGLPQIQRHKMASSGRTLIDGEWVETHSEPCSRGNDHATVKPVRLFGYFCALLCPPGGVILDTFAGSGTTGVATLLEGRRAILIEREAEYCRIAEARCAHAERQAEEKRRRRAQLALELEAAGG
jgi:hypothetical protein